MYTKNEVGVGIIKAYFELHKYCYKQEIQHFKYEDKEGMNELCASCFPA